MFRYIAIRIIVLLYVVFQLGFASDVPIDFVFQYPFARYSRFLGGSGFPLVIRHSLCGPVPGSSAVPGAPLGGSSGVAGILQVPCPAPVRPPAPGPGMASGPRRGPRPLSIKSLVLYIKS